MQCPEPSQRGQQTMSREPLRMQTMHNRVEMLCISTQVWTWSIWNYLLRQTAPVTTGQQPSVNICMQQEKQHQSTGLHNCQIVKIQPEQTGLPGQP